jgi:hypothetical protein
LIEVLKDLADRDPKIKKLLAKIEEASTDYENENTATQNYAREILAAVSAAPPIREGEPDGWCYLGTWHDEAWSGSDKSLNGDAPAKKDQERTLTKDLRLRADYPKKANNWEMAKPVGAVREGQTVRIERLHDAGRGRLWAQVSIIR